MLNSWMESISDANIITILLLLIVLFSLLQGWSRGFGRSAGGLFGLLGTGLLAIAALALAIPAAFYLSPRVQTWAGGIELPDIQLSHWQQLYYTAVSVLAGSPLVRFCCCCSCPTVSSACCWDCCLCCFRFPFRAFRAGPETGRLLR